MEAVGSIKAHEVKAAEVTVSAKQASLQKQEEPRGQRGRNGVLDSAAGAGGREERQARIERIAEAMDNYVKSIQRDLDIRIDRETGTVMVKVLNRETGEVIREIPPEELLNLASKMEEVAGVLLNKSA